MLLANPDANDHSAANITKFSIAPWQNSLNLAQTALQMHQGGWQSGRPQSWGNLRRNNLSENLGGLIAQGLTSDNLQPALAAGWATIAAIYDPAANAEWRDDTGYTYLVVKYTP